MIQLKTLLNEEDKRITFPDGTRYVGTIDDDGKPHGNGMKLWPEPNFAKYEGDWVHGKMTGNGRFTSEDVTYKGEWLDGLFHGKGIRTTGYGDDEKVYTGQFKNGNKDGYGVYTHDGDTFKGHYVDNERNGHGVYTYEDGSYHKGQYKNGQRNGYGIYVSITGDEWKGNWANDTLNGKVATELDKMKAPADTTPRDNKRWKFEDDTTWIYAKNKNEDWLASKRGTTKWYNLEKSANPKVRAAAGQLEIRATPITS